MSHISWMKMSGCVIKRNKHLCMRLDKVKIKVGVSISLLSSSSESRDEIPFKGGTIVTP